jgi:hypothetical protein
MMRRDFNSFTFIDQARVIHGYRYNYSTVTYMGIDRPVTIECKLHGSFELTPNQHLIGEGCPRCTS